MPVDQFEFGDESANRARKGDRQATLHVNVWTDRHQVEIWTSRGQSIVMTAPTVDRLVDAIGRAGRFGLHHWMEFLSENEFGICGLCGNHGFIPAHSVTTPGGVVCAVKEKACICPNGRARKAL